MKQSVILAAGNGYRIQQKDGDHVGKPLVKVMGKPLIEHALEQATAAGCERALVVLGNKADLVLSYLESRTTNGIEIETVYNERFDLPNGVSLLAAEGHTEDRFFLQMADHVFARPVLGELLKRPHRVGDPMRLLVDRDPVYFDEDDATKVRMDDERITAIGKELDHYDAIDAGCFLLDARIFEGLRAARESRPPSLTDGVRTLLADRLLEPVSLEGVGWVDVDTPREVELVEATLRVPEHVS